MTLKKLILTIMEQKSSNNGLKRDFGFVLERIRFPKEI